MRELGTFAVVYPCWALLHKASFRRDASGKVIGYKTPIQILIIDDKDGNGTVPIFSDGDLSQRFKSDSRSFDDFLTLKVTTSEMLVSMLEQCRGNADSMSFDQPKMCSKPFGIWPLEYAIKRLRDGGDL